MRNIHLGESELPCLIEKRFSEKCLRFNSKEQRSKGKLPEAEDRMTVIELGKSGTEGRN